MTWRSRASSKDSSYLVNRRRLIHKGRSELYALIGSASRYVSRKLQGQDRIEAQFEQVRVVGRCFRQRDEVRNTISDAIGDVALVKQVGGLGRRVEGQALVSSAHVLLKGCIRGCPHDRALVRPWESSLSGDDDYKIRSPDHGVIGLVRLGFFDD